MLGKSEKERKFIKTLGFFVLIFVLTFFAQAKACEQEEDAAFITFTKDLERHKFANYPMSVNKRLTVEQVNEFCKKMNYHIEQTVIICKQIDELCVFIPNTTYRQNARTSVAAVIEAVLVPGSSKQKAAVALVSLIRSYLICCYDQYVQLETLQYELQYHAQMADHYISILNYG